MQTQGSPYEVNLCGNSEVLNIEGGIRIGQNLLQVFYEREKILRCCYLRKGQQSSTSEQGMVQQFLIFTTISAVKITNFEGDLLP
jgi:hypothetical protein